MRGGDASGFVHSYWDKDIINPLRRMFWHVRFVEPLLNNKRFLE
jgi:hypothetical protein